MTNDRVAEPNRPILLRSRNNRQRRHPPTEPSLAKVATGDFPITRENGAADDSLSNLCVRPVAAGVRCCDSSGTEESRLIAMNTATSVPPAVRQGTCFVTGGTGLVGNNIVRRLLEGGSQVRVLVRPRQGGTDRSLEGLSVDQRTGTLEDEACLQQAVDGASLVIHSAAVVHCGWRHSEEMRRVNVEGTSRLARAARRAGARFVHVSSVDALGLRADGLPADEETPPGGMVECPYVVTKREAEAAVLAEVDQGLDATDHIPNIDKVVRTRWG
ncbi:MAG: NAD-dependent epimerase/dehydratase family protein [Planctomycetia bacterium]|nr:NAD-dependent epimerase/dehydratase family protein [Planctomycetia bacterium]